MFDRKGVDPQWLLVADYMRALPEGQIASLAEIAAVADCKSEAVSSIVHITNKKAADTGLRLVAVRGKGYRCATPADGLTEATVIRPSRARAAIRQIRKATGFVISHAESTDAERKAATDADAHAAGLERMARSTQRQMSKLRPEVPVVKTSRDL
ncbi:MAG: hypothetical protein AB7O86_05670 [Porticoccaceae bacterium]